MFNELQYHWTFIIKVTYPCPVLALLEVLREGNFQSDSESKNKTRSRTTEMKSVSFSEEQMFFISIKNSSQLFSCRME